MVLSICLSIAPAGAENSKKIVILPLAINANQDLSFLQRGLQNMITSRLTVPGRLVPVESQKVAETLAADPSLQAPLPPSRAIELARNLGADYVVVGSLTVFGETISTDAQVFEVATGTPQVSFHQLGASQSEVIRHVDAFSADVNQTLLGIEPQQATAAVIAPTPAAPTPSDPRRHPEALLTPSPTAAPTTGAQIPRTPTEPWISRPFKTELHGVAVGDVDGDGANEVVTIASNELLVQRLTQGQLVRVAQYDARSHNIFLKVDVADINANGKAEIFVTNLPANSDRLRSFVLEWEDNKLKPIAEKQNWFYHVMAGPDGEMGLYGQKKGEDISTFGFDRLFDGGVYSLEWRDGQYETDLRQHLPKGTNILSLAYGDAVEADGRTVLSYNREYRLDLFNSEGDEIWTSESFQGTRNLYIDRDAEKIDRDSTRTKRIYLPHRILVADLNGNGQREIIVPYNAENMASLTRTKLFKNGYVQGLEWNGLGMLPAWKTDPAAKFIADVNLGDVDNDGITDVVYAVVNKTAITKKKQRSTLVVQRFVQAQ
jgi:hypothetical protein